MKYVWACSCGVKTDCTFDDMKIGGYFQCPECKEAAVGLVSKSGSKVFVKLDQSHVDFVGLFDPPMIED